MRVAGFEASLRDLGISVCNDIPTSRFWTRLAPSHARLYRLERLLLADGKAVGPRHSVAAPSVGRQVEGPTYRANSLSLCWRNTASSSPT